MQGFKVLGFRVSRFQVLLYFYLSKGFHGLHINRSIKQTIQKSFARARSNLRRYGFCARRLIEGTKACARAMDQNSHQQYQLVLCQAVGLSCIQQWCFCITIYTRTDFTLECVWGSILVVLTPGLISCAQKWMILSNE